MATQNSATPEKSTTPRSSEINTGKLGNSKEVDLDRSGVNSSPDKQNASSTTTDTDQTKREGLELDSDSSSSDESENVSNERVRKDSDSGHSASV